MNGRLRPSRIRGILLAEIQEDFDGNKPSSEVQAVMDNELYIEKLVSEAAYHSAIKAVIADLEKYNADVKNYAGRIQKGQLTDEQERCVNITEQHIYQFRQWLKPELEGERR